MENEFQIVNNIPTADKFVTFSDEVNSVMYRNELYEQYKMFWPTSFSERENNIYAAIICGVRDQGTEDLFFRFRDIKKVLELDPKLSNNKVGAIIADISSKLNEIKWKYLDEKNSGFEMPLFYHWLWDTEKGILAIRVNEGFAYLLNNIEENCNKTGTIGYTKFSLTDYYSLTSKYAQNLFRALSRYHKLKRYCEIETARLSKILGCPEEYDARHINERVILPALYKIRKIRGYKKLSVYVKKENRKIISYGFCWSKPGKEIIEGNKYRPLDVVDMDN